MIFPYNALTLPFSGNQNISFLVTGDEEAGALDGYGRSHYDHSATLINQKPQRNGRSLLDNKCGRNKYPLMHVRSNGVSMYQTYTEFSLTPSEGSTAGGTRLTIRGKYFDETKPSAPAKVEVAGKLYNLTFVSWDSTKFLYTCICCMVLLHDLMLTPGV